MSSRFYPYLKLAYYLMIGYFTYLMALITIQYFPIKLNAAFLNIKFEELQIPYYKYAFFIHVYTSIFVLFAGIFQFSKTIRSNHSSIHRLLGKIYVFLILVFASPSGLIMAIHANGGLYSKISFCLQAILWFAFTLFALKFAKGKKWEKHQDFMLRSFALTLSAISLRLFKWIIVSIFELPPMDTYKIVSWAGWLFNLTIIEYYIFWKNKIKTNSSTAPPLPLQ